MAPPSKKPTLASLDPEAFAVQICEAVISQITRLVVPLGPSIRIEGKKTASDLARSTDLGITAQTLCRYAQEGIQLDALPIDYVQSIAEALYTRPGTSPTYDIPDLDSDADPNTEWGLVFIAALAREKIVDGRAVSSREVAALSSLSQRQIQNLTAAGELPKDSDGYAADVALKFLGARNVPGF